MAAGGFFARRGTSLVHHHLNLIIDYQQRNLPERVGDHIPEGNQHSSSGSQKSIFALIAAVIIIIIFPTLPLGTPSQARWLPDLKHFSSRAKESQDKYLVGKYIPVLVGEAFPCQCDKQVSNSLVPLHIDNAMHLHGESSTQFDPISAPSNEHAFPEE